jgi:hypothetical protein
MQTISKFLSLSVLGALVVLFSVVLLVLAAPLFISIFISRIGGPETGGVVFTISRRAFTGGLLTFMTIVALAAFFTARTLRRRRLNR